MTDRLLDTSQDEHGLFAMSLQHSYMHGDIPRRFVQVYPNSVSVTP